MEAYASLVSGTAGWWDLLRYELVAAWGGSIPGAAGLAFRRLLWPTLLEAADRTAVWGHGIELRYPGRMRIGRRVVVDGDSRLDAKGCARGSFVLGDDVLISRGCVLSAKEGGVRIGPRSTVGAGTVLYSFGGSRSGPTP